MVTNVNIENMEKEYYIKLLEESILRKIKTVPINAFVYNAERGWNECGIDCLLSYEYKQPNGGRIILYMDFNRIVDVASERFIFSERLGKLFDVREDFAKGNGIYGCCEFTEYDCLLEWVDKSLCTFEEHMGFVANETEKIIRKYGDYIRKGTYFNDSSVSKYHASKIASDIKYKCNEYGITFYVDVETYDIDYKNSCLVKRDSYGWRSVEKLAEIKYSIIEDVRDFIEEARAEKIKEIDECIDNLKLEREKLLPNVF